METQKLPSPIYVYKLPHTQVRFVCDVPDDNPCRCKSASELGQYLAQLIYETKQNRLDGHSLYDMCMHNPRGVCDNLLAWDHLPQRPLHGAEIQPKLLTQTEYELVLESIKEELVILQSLDDKMDEGEIPVPFDVG